MQKNFCKGFTLIEVMVVVVISLVVVAFSVPVYKKTQEKNRYMAAQGVLLDLANGVRMLKAEYPGISGELIVTNNNTTTDNNDPENSNYVAWMMEHKYINPIKFDSGATTYMKYSFKVNPSGTASCSTCAAGVACMYGTNAIPEYQCASVDKSGIVHTKP